MRTVRLLRTLVMSGVILLPLAGCATYDDSGAHARCEEPGWVKDLPPEAAKRESRCKDSVEVWNSEGRNKNDPPLDFSGKKKDN